MKNKTSKKTGEKPVMVSYAEAARRLAAEHPEFPYTATQLQRMGDRRQITCMFHPSCGMQRRTFGHLNYNILVAELSARLKPAIHMTDNV